MSTFRIHISFQEWPSSLNGRLIAWTHLVVGLLIVLTLMSVSLLLNGAVQGSRTSSTKHRSIASKFYATLDFIILPSDFRQCQIHQCLRHDDTYYNIFGSLESLLFGPLRRQ